MPDAEESVPQMTAAILFPLPPLAAVAVRFGSEVVGFLAVISALLGVRVAANGLLETLEVDGIVGQ